MKDVKRGSRPQKRITILQLSSVHYVLHVTRDPLLLYCSLCSRLQRSGEISFPLLFLHDHCTYLFKVHF